MAILKNDVTASKAKARLSLCVAEKRICAEGIVAIELVSCDGANLPPFTAGSHIDLFLPGGLTRQYSLRNNPHERHRYALGVLRDASGRGGSTYMHDRLNVGDTIETSWPRNAFKLDEAAPFSLLVAGGIGVTPILAMAHRLFALGRDFEFHYAARNETRMAFRDEIDASPFATKVRYHLDDGPISQRLDLDQMLAQRTAGAHLYACGPSGFLSAIISKSATAWPPQFVHREYFANTTHEPASGDQTFVIKLARDGRSFEVPPGRSIVEVLAENGIDVAVSCEQGICGTCMTRVVTGEPDHRDLVLTEKQRNGHMTLCCSRARSAELMLDL